MACYFIIRLIQFSWLYQKYHSKLVPGFLNLLIVRIAAALPPLSTSASLSVCTGLCDTYIFVQLMCTYAQVAKQLRRFVHFLGDIVYDSNIDITRLQ